MFLKSGVWRKSNSLNQENLVRENGLFSKNNSKFSFKNVSFNNY